MEEIYVNADYDKPKSPINHTGPSSFKRSFHSGVVLSLGLLSMFLLIGLITTGVHLRDSAADLSATSSKLSSMTEERDHLKGNLSTMSNKLSSMTGERDHLKGNLSTMSNKLSSMTRERDLLRANLTEKISELERLQSLSKQKKICPTGWTKFCSSCYLLSAGSGSWDAGRKDCRDKGADLVVIDSPEEQAFLSTIIQTNTWIGLNDKEQEGQWKWVDGTPLTLSYWATNEPNNAGALHHDEDCVHVRDEDRRTWNDISCTSSFKWICEKIP